MSRTKRTDLNSIITNDGKQHLALNIHTDLELDIAYNRQKTQEELSKREMRSDIVYELDWSYARGQNRSVTMDDEVKILNNEKTKINTELRDLLKTANIGYYNDGSAYILAKSAII